MKPTTRRCLPYITDPDSVTGSVLNSHGRRINYSAPKSLVFMPIHISCSSAQNNVKLRYADVGNWWDRQQTPPQTAFYKLIGLISAGGGEYTVQWLLYRRFDVLTHLVFSWKITTNCRIQKITLDGLSALHNATYSIYRRYNNIRRVGGGCFLLVDVYYGPLRRHGNMQYLFILSTYSRWGGE